jgi:cytidylate kinase
MKFARPITIALAGGIGSGKSSIATQVAERLDWPCASFGGFLRKIARGRGLSESREVLQEIGAEMMHGDLLKFCLAVIGQTNWVRPGSLVLDGIRHSEVLPIIRDLTAPAEFVMIFVVTPREVRLSRLQQRGRYELERLDQVEAHSTELQVPSLEELADLQVDGTRDTEAVVDQVVDWLSERFSA